MTPEVAIVGSGTAAADGAASIVLTGDVFLPGGELPVDHAIGALLRGATWTVANVEGPLTDREAPAPKAGPALRMPAAAAAALARAGVGVCGLANNHVGDHGPEGVAETLRACREAGLQTVGAGEDLGTATGPLRLTAPGARPVTLFAACEAEFGIAAPGRAGVAPISAAGLEEAVARAAADSFVIVLAHGGNEELRIPSTQRREQLRRLAAAGAGLVVGHHPHVPQGWERAGEGVVFYSLGDFAFGAQQPAAHAAWGYAVRCVLGADGPTALEVVPVERVGGIVGPAAPHRAAELERLAALAGSPELDDWWRAAAAVLYEDRYLPFLRQAAGARDLAPPPGGPLRRLRAAPDRAPDPEAVAAADRLLLVLLRCESHRWAMETGAAVLGGALAHPGLDGASMLADRESPAWP